MAGGGERSLANYSSPPLDRGWSVGLEGGWHYLTCSVTLATEHRGQLAPVGLVRRLHDRKLAGPVALRAFRGFVRLVHGHFLYSPEQNRSGGTRVSQPRIPATHHYFGGSVGAQITSKSAALVNWALGTHRTMVPVQRFSRSEPSPFSDQWFVRAIAPAINAPAMMMAAACWFILKLSACASIKGVFSAYCFVVGFFREGTSTPFPCM